MSTPPLSAGTVALITDLLNNVTLPVTHPNLEELAGMWATAKRELAALDTTEKKD